MRFFMNIVDQMERDLALVEIDPRFATLVNCLGELRGSEHEPDRDDPRKIERIRAVTTLMMQTMADLCRDHDIDGEVVHSLAYEALREKDH